MKNFFETGQQNSAEERVVEIDGISLRCQPNGLPVKITGMFRRPGIDPALRPVIVSVWNWKMPQAKINLYNDLPYGPIVSHDVPVDLDKGFDGLHGVRAAIVRMLKTFDSFEQGNAAAISRFR